MNVTKTSTQQSLGMVLPALVCLHVFEWMQFTITKYFFYYHWFRLSDFVHIQCMQSLYKHNLLIILKMITTKPAPLSPIWYWLNVSQFCILWVTCVHDHHFEFELFEAACQSFGARINKHTVFVELCCNWDYTSWCWLSQKMWTSAWVRGDVFHWPYGFVIYFVRQTDWWCFFISGMKFGPSQIYS